MTATAKRTSAEYHQRARELEASGGEKPVKIAVLASFTAELLKPYIVVESADLGCRIAPWFAPFGQFEQMIMNPGSPLWKEEYELIWIALRLEDLDRHLHLEHPSLGPERTTARLDALRSRVIAAAKAARANTRATLLVSNFAFSSLYAPGVFDASDPDGFGHLLAATNWQLAKDAAALSDTHVFDYQGLVNASGAVQWADPKLWYMARTVCSAANHAALAQGLARAVSALVRPAVKCIVLDLDNTLWGGVLGDDGLEGIKLGDDYPGNVFKEFQAALLGLHQRGFLLAIATKNDEATVLEGLRFHPEMVLREKHFASIFANWDSKPANLRRIAEALNIGPDAMLFVDDNPVERAQMRAEMPMVHVLELPTETTSYVAALQDCSLFDRPRLLLEDRRRGEMYEQSRQRSKHLEGGASLEQALRDLQMVAQVGEAGPQTLERIHQLIQKTNQFNLTTRRHQLEEVRNLAQAPEARVAWLRLQDRYGAQGLVCVGILRKLDPECWEVDTFLMSCRVGGRQVEAAFMGYLAELARAGGARRLRGVFRPSAKNEPVRRLYPELGFRSVPSSSKDSEQVFEIELADGVLPWPDLITREEITKRDDA
jgi:FkbH-like protein